MKAAAIAVLVVLAAAVVVEGQTCHYDCYNVTSENKEALLKQCGVTNYKVVTSDVSAVYSKPAPGCQTAACAQYANDAAIANYRDNCEHPDPKYAALRGHGVSYNAPCASCQ